MKICLKWVHMARYGLILKLDGAPWHTIISGPLLTPKRAMESSKIRKKVQKLLELAKLIPCFMICQYEISRPFKMISYDAVPAFVDHHLIVV